MPFLTANPRLRGPRVLVPPIDRTCSFDDLTQGEMERRQFISITTPHAPHLLCRSQSQDPGTLHFFLVICSEKIGGVQTGLTHQWLELVSVSQRTARGPRKRIFDSPAVERHKGLNKRGTRLDSEELSFCF